MAGQRKLTDHESREVEELLSTISEWQRLANLTNYPTVKRRLETMQRVDESRMRSLLFGRGRRYAVQS